MTSRPEAVLVIDNEYCRFEPAQLAAGQTLVITWPANHECLEELCQALGAAGLSADYDESHGSADVFLLVSSDFPGRIRVPDSGC